MKPIIVIIGPTGVGKTKLSIELAKKLGLLIKDNHIIVNENMETNIKGVYACGDCTGGLMQVSKSVYQGTVAGLEVIKFLNKNK